jgi:hypothetical protein
VPVFRSCARSFNELFLGKTWANSEASTRGVIRNVSKRVVVSAGIVAQLTVGKIVLATRCTKLTLRNL